MKGGNASNFGGGPNPPYNPFMNQSQPQIPPPSNYSTTGVPQVPPGRVSFDDIDNAVKNQNGLSPLHGMDPTAPAPSYTASNQPPRPPSISSDTLYSERLNEKAGISNGLSALAAGQASSSTSGMSRIMQYAQSQYTGPPILPAINSGEMFEWGDIVGTNERRNVDAIANAGLASSAIVPPPETYYGQQPLAMPQPPQLVGSTAGPYGSAQNNASSNSLAAPSSYPQSRPNSASAHAVSRPPSATYSSYNATQIQHVQVPSDPVSVYTRARSSQSHLGIGYAASSHYTSSNEQVFDHFGQDVEAYASGRDSGVRKNVRSRSATPMGNEEYMAVGAGEDEGEDDELDDDNEDEDTMEESTTDYYNDNEKKEYGYSYGYGSESRVHFVNPIPEQPYKYPDTPVTTQHYGPAPAGRVMRRIHQKKRVQLTNGNLVIDLNVPTKLVLPLRREEEMLKTRYTAVTCDPDDFKKNNFFLRQNEYGRSTELFIAVTMYNEDEVLFCRTLNGVMRNIGHLCTRRNSQTWGQDAWKKVVVCIISDGRKKIHPRVLDCLTALGVYQNGNFMKNMVNNKPVTAHVFEYTASFGLDENLHFRYPDKGIVPTQILFCLKEKNLKKINSHRWFFNAFAPLLKPNVCVLIDVGTRPGPKSLYYLWKTFDLNSNVAGACGEIAAYKGRRWKSLLNPLVASQNFEYKISNILDKPTESLFGYISVLPGAFSAYRYIALQNNKHGFGPLASYFKGEVLHGRDTDIFTSNMYLAEDRILCFELVAKEKSDWVLRYVKNAVGETDVPEALPEFISQRRRWLNGSFFASIYAVAHAAQIIRSGHSTGRKVMLMIETVYNIINLVFAWFSLGNFYLFFNIVTSSLEDPAFGLDGISYFNSIIQYAYVSIVIACFLFSMGNRPKASPWKYKLSSIFFAIINIYTIVAACLCASQAATQGGAVYSAMLFSVIITYGAYAISSLLALDPWHMLTSFVPYILLSPTYINILNIYAFSNLDDISWGTKQDNDVDTDLGAVIQNSQSQVDVEILTEPSDVNQMYEETLANLRTRKPVEKPTPRTSESEREQQTKDYYANVRTNVLLVWVLSNGLLLLAILSTGDPSKTFSSGSNVTKIYMTFILAFVGITSIIRFAGSTLYMLAYILMG